MRELPILFSGAMVRAILDGRKTETRRVCKDMAKWVVQDCREVRNIDGRPHHFMIGARDPMERLRCPYGNAGDRLWVRETSAQPVPLDPGPTFYRADYPACVPTEYENVPLEDAIRWRPSIHMPRLASRILLEVTDVCVERLQDGSEEDARTEGC